MQNLRQTHPLQADKKKNQIETLKPWIKKGIKQSKLGTDFDMINTKNIQLHQIKIKEKSFKKYRNKIKDLIKINRKPHYRNF